MGALSTGNGLTWLDGGVATELERAGMPVRAPWWTTFALTADSRRTLLRRIHERYLAAGADIITADTFRCNLRALRAMGLDQGGGLAWMVHAAVGVAKAACRAEGSTALIAGSMAPVEDCFRPDLVPSDRELRSEHRWLATELVRAGVDLVLIETMNTAREACVALEEVHDVGGRAWVSFVCDHDGRLLSGEPLTEAVASVEPDRPEVILVNCTTPDGTENALRAVRETYSGPLGAYPNAEDRSRASRSTGALPTAVSPVELADRFAAWRANYGIAVAGGCCGTTPDHISTARAMSVPQ